MENGTNGIVLRTTILESSLKNSTIPPLPFLYHNENGFGEFCWKQVCVLILNENYENSSVIFCTRHTKKPFIRVNGENSKMTIV